MKNYVDSGDRLTAAAPYDRTSGQGALIGSIFGVAAGNVLSGVLGVFELRGTYDLTKVGSEAWTVGAKVYWDNTNKRCTTVSTDNTLIGAAAAAVGSGAGETTGRVWVPGIVA